MAVIFDSCVWIGYLRQTDALHERAEAEFDKVKETIIVPYSVAAEVANILVGRISKQEADNFLIHIVNNQDIELVEDDYVKGIVFFGSFDEKMSFTDYSLISLARDKGYKLITFDEKMKRFLKDDKYNDKAVSLKSKNRLPKNKS